MHKLISTITGIGLLETLSTVLIVSFGLVGLATLQTKNTVSLNNSIMAMKATFYAQDIVQKMAGNVSIARNTDGYVLNSYTNTPTIAAATPICVTTICTPDQLAIFDMNIWLQKIKNDLPNGKAQITKESSAGNILYTIQIQWQYKTDIRTYQLVVQI